MENRYHGEMDTHPPSQPYPSDVSENEWAFIAPYLMLMTEAVPQCHHDLPEIFNSSASVEVHDRLSLGMDI